MKVDPLLAIELNEKGKAIRSLTSAVLKQLRAEIMSCRLPPGEKLLIAGLVERYGVSLGAIREALSRLVAEGWVQAEDQRGFRVSPVSIEDLLEVTQARIEIEAIVLRRAIARGDSDWEQLVRESYERLSSTPRPSPGDSGALFELWTEHHRRFHSAIVDAGNSKTLNEFRAILFQRCERYRFLSYGLRARDVEGEHRAIMEAVLARDVEAAVKALSDHHNLTAQIVLDGQLKIPSYTPARSPNRQ